MPADADPRSDHEDADDPRLVLFGDGRWHPVMLLARQRDRQGRERVLLEWSAGGDRWEAWYLADREKVREG